MKDVPAPRSRTPIGPHGYGQAGTRIDPWARRLWPCGLVDTAKQAQGTTLSRVADTHGPSWARGNDEKDASLPGKACGRRVASIPGSDEKVHRFEGRARPCALIDAQIRRRATAIPEEGRRLGCASIPSSAGGPYSIAPVRDSLRALGVRVRREGSSLVRRRV